MTEISRIWADPSTGTTPVVGVIGPDDPTTVSGGVDLPIGSTYIRRSTGAEYKKIGSATTAWIQTTTGGTEPILAILNVKPTAGSSSYSIVYSGVGGAVMLSINGAAYVSAPPSPIVVTRPGAGSSPLEYTFFLDTGDQSVTNSVTIQPIDKDTVAADLAVVPTNPLAGSQDFVVTGTNPSGGTPPVLEGLIRGAGGANMSSGATLTDGVVFIISSGETIRVNRAPFGTTAQVSVTFFASISGAPVEKIQRTIQNQVRASFGPSLTVTPTPSSGAYSLAYSGTYDTLVLSINGGTYAAPPGSPITVTRTSSDQTYTFVATKDSQNITVAVTIPAATTAAVSNRFGSCSLNGDDSTNQLTVNWTFSGESGVTFRVLSGEGSTAPSAIATVESESASSGFSYPSGYDLVASGGAGSILFAVRVEALDSNGSLLTAISQSHSHRVTAL